tara:strand:- start:1706 stop:2773 length:1068 start_codon:yes stop_codon:yes gene_type:complete
MNNIIEPNINYDFSKIELGLPTYMSGNYFVKALNNNKPLYIQTPKCVSKNGFVKNKRQGYYIDLLFDGSDVVFINWIENLESKCIDLLYNNRNNLFQNDIDKEDIEDAFVSLIKIYKSGKYYVMRLNVRNNIKIYSENSNTSLNIDEDIDPSTNIISIIEIQGIKYSAKSFHIEVDLKQSMVVSADPFLDSCFINMNTTKNIPVGSNEIKVNKLGEIEKTIEEVEETNEVNEVEETNEVNGVEETNEVNGVEETNEINEVEETNEVNGVEETNEIEEINEINEINEIKEIKEIIPDSDDSLLTLKTANDVYRQIYIDAKEKINKLKEETRIAYLELERIKKNYGIIDENENEDTN